MEDGRRTADGYEMHFGVNHLGHVALAARMAEHMGRSPPTAGRGGDDAGGGHHDGGRIVFVSSGLLRSGRIDLEGREFVTLTLTLTLPRGSEATASAAAASPSPRRATATRS